MPGWRCARLARAQRPARRASLGGARYCGGLGSGAWMAGWRGVWVELVGWGWLGGLGLGLGLRLGWG
ncbi:hypothetical protein FKR81_39955 [Lentzea tibetensis]|uniref:Uncharacterized protein n=1 Tax=Lentzea tibetensis TaxID=2591470 RepID=A0A563EG12_9PSEU|nr:hypothetical protein FKR81_39955 [Lentzea tibetensis]